jgi:hypothetical protein
MVGESLAVSFPRTKEQPPTLEQVNLAGQRSALYTFADEEPVDPKGLYPWAFIGLKWSPDGQAIALTAGPAATADYHSSPSPSGEKMMFLRLERFDQGSLYLQPLDAPEQQVEILRGLRGSPGFYGNYYPEWLSVYWF